MCITSFVTSPPTVIRLAALRPKNPAANNFFHADAFTANAASPTDTRDVPWNDVVRFVRQLSHDLRNHLNAIELQSTFLAELAQDGELKPEVQRLREMTYEIGVTLQKLTGAMSEANPRLMSYRAADFVDDLREKLEADRPKESGSIEWDVKLGDETLQIDPQLMQQAGLELFNN